MLINNNYKHKTPTFKLLIKCKKQRQAGKTDQKLFWKNGIIFNGCRKRNAEHKEREGGEWGEREREGGGGVPMQVKGRAVHQIDGSSWVASGDVEENMEEKKGKERKKKI